MKNIILFLLILPLFSGCNYIHRNTIGLLSSPEENSSPHPSSEQRTENSFTSQGEHTSTSLAPPTHKTTRIEVEKLHQAKEPTLDQVEVLWEIPSVSVDSFILHYGSSPKDLKHEAILLEDEIQKFKDPTHGEVYRHVLKVTPDQEKVFVSMASVKDGVTSPFSAPFEVGQ